MHIQSHTSGRHHQQFAFTFSRNPTHLAPEEDSMGLHERPPTQQQPIDSTMYKADTNALPAKEGRYILASRPTSCSHEGNVVRQE
jgi:hypothetical protein